MRKTLDAVEVPYLGRCWGCGALAVLQPNDHSAGRCWVCPECLEGIEALEAAQAETAVVGP